MLVCSFNGGYKCDIILCEFSEPNRKMSDEIYKPLSKSDTNPLRYACFQAEVRDHISKIDMPVEVRGHIDDLYELIHHQLKQQMRQEAQMISVKHMEAWKMYYRPWKN